MIEMNRILVVVAHPDDEVLGCGGLIMELAARGKEVYTMYFNGGSSSRPNWERVPQQIKAVNELLGSRVYGIFNYPNHHFDRFDQNDFNDKVSRAIFELGVDTVLTHSDTDLHCDHLIVNKACMVACRFKREVRLVRNLVTFPTISSSDISPKFQFHPNLYVNVGPHLSKKVEAMAIYDMELEAMAYARGEEAITAWAAFFGLQSAFEYAEPYNIIRSTV